MAGAVDFEECPRYGRGSCRCERCAVCGHRKHTGVHGPLLRQPPGSQPWGHEFHPAHQQPGKGE